jgi:Holliday junction resolvase RusA-like endonuclease
MRLSFTVPGPIRGKQRAGRRLIGGKVQTFNPPGTAANERLIRQYAAIQMRGKNRRFEGPVGLTIRVFKTPPKSWSPERKATAHFVTGKPDVDNIAKLVADALDVIWRDDSQISDLTITRRYDAAERTEIEIITLEAV